jgi:TrmH family RNA methyltransferase
MDRTDALTDYIARLRAEGRRVFAAALDESAEQLGSFAIQTGDCAVIGNEGHGLSSSVIEACGRTVYIPMTDRAESLNAAVASALLMWEFGRKG